MSCEAEGMGAAASSRWPFVSVKIHRPIGNFFLSVTRTRTCLFGGGETDEYNLLGPVATFREEIDDINGRP